MQTQPPITLTRSDHVRLRRLLDEAGANARQLLLERLEEELHRARVVDTSADNGFVTLGSRVTFDNLKSGQRREVMLVLPDDAQPGTERLSVLSPIGCSLIGLRPGDRFTWDDGQRRWGLLVVSVQSGD